LSLPLHLRLTNEDVAHVSASVCHVLRDLKARSI